MRTVTYEEGYEKGYRDAIGWARDELIILKKVTKTEIVFISVIDEILADLLENKNG